MTQVLRDPWRVAWQIATSDGLLVILLLTVALGLTLAAWLPQKPSASVDPVGYAQWLSEIQPRFGETASTLQALGLFTITRSLGFRTLVALLAGCLFLRLARSAGEIREQRTWISLFHLSAHAGALLLLGGLLLTQLWGWQIKGLILQAGERAALDGHDAWVALDKETNRITHSPGIVTFIESRGPGSRITAVSDAGRSLPLQRTPDADPITQLTLALTEDQYFAIPEAQLVIRLLAERGQALDAHSSVLVQVYRSRSGQLITSAEIAGDMDLTVDGVTLEFTSMPYARLTATFNPGLWPTGIGLLLLTAGLSGHAARSARRLNQQAGEATKPGEEN